MSADTYVSFRQEWYDSDREPDEPPRMPRLNLGPMPPGIQQADRNLTLTAESSGGLPTLGDTYIDHKSGKMVVVINVDHSNQTYQIANVDAVKIKPRFR